MFVRAGEEFYGNMTALSLSNTGLSADDVASIATFLQNNETLEVSSPRSMAAVFAVRVLQEPADTQPSP